MRVYDAQLLGALMILLASLVFYGGTRLMHRYGLDHPGGPLPWGNQGPDTIAVEVSGIGSADGIYFLPERTSISTLLNPFGLTGKIELPNEPSKNSAGYSIFVNEDSLRLTYMPALRMLALGLPMNLNRVSMQDLAHVPGVGEGLAHQIIELRSDRGRFQSLSELKAIRGIKEKKLYQLQKYLTVWP